MRWMMVVAAAVVSVVSSPVWACMCNFGPYTDYEVSLASEAQPCLEVGELRWGFASPYAGIGESARGHTLALHNNCAEALVVEGLRFEVLGEQGVRSEVERLAAGSRGELLIPLNEDVAGRQERNYRARLGEAMFDVVVRYDLATRQAYESELTMCAEACEEAAAVDMGETVEADMGRGDAGPDSAPQAPVEPGRSGWELDEQQDAVRGESSCTQQRPSRPRGSVVVWLLALCAWAGGRRLLLAA